MKIIVKCNGRYKDDKDAHKFLNKHARYMWKLIPKLADEFNLKLPSELVLRNMRYRDYPLSVGNFNYDPLAEYSIVLDIESCLNRPDKGGSVVEHECAHLVNALKDDYWGHGERFEKMYSVACKMRNRKKIRRKRNA